MKHLKTFNLFEKYIFDKSIADPTKNPDFVKWFGKSKVVDGSKPMPVYHGTKSEFDEFSWSSFGQTDDGYYGRGFYFTPTPEEARDYGKIVLGVYLKIENPFWLRVDSSMGSAVLLDTRDDLSVIPGYEKLKTNRTLPDGYYIKKSDGDIKYGEKTVTLAVYPKKELYGTDRELYGEDQTYMESDPELTNGSAEIQAIVAFNDELEGNSYDVGWTSQLLKKIDRDAFTDVLGKAGYDGVFVAGATKLGETLDMSNVVEFIIFDDYQIKSATDNSGKFDPKSNNIFEND